MLNLKKKEKKNKIKQLISFRWVYKLRSGAEKKKEQIPIEKEIDSKWISNIGNNNKNQIVD